MWEFIIPILVQLLVAFLTQLLKDIMGATLYGAPLPDLVSAKAEFMSKVKWRFWLGPKRMQYASGIYDRMHGRFALQLSSSGIIDVPVTVQNCTDGLDDLTPADLGDGLTKFTADGTRNFKVMQNGLVQGGFASYLLSPSTGQIIYRASIRVGKWFLTKTYENHGTYQIDPTLLNPTNITVGKVLTIGDLQMKVMSLAQNTAIVSISIIGQDATGTAILSLVTNVVALQALDATVKVLGMSLVIGLRQEK
jgi:hypothetical protein